MRFTCFLAVFCAGVLAPRAEVALTNRVVFPPGAESEEQQGSGALFVGESLREMLLYTSAALMPLMPNGGYITEIAFRLDGESSPPYAASGVIEVHMSTSQHDGMPPARRFSEAVGPSPVIVRERGSIDFVAPSNPPGPNPFDIRIPLDTRYFYDPAAGSLIIDIYTGSLWAFRPDSGGGGGGITMGGGALEDRIDGYYAIPVIEILYQPIPEPGTLVLAFAGTLICWGHRTIRHRKERQ